MATATETAVREAKQFIGGDVGRCGRRRDVRGSRPVQRRGRRDRAGRNAGGRAPRDRRRGRGAFPEWSQSPPAQRQGIFLKAADILESPRRRDRRDARARDRLHVRLRDVPDELRAGPVPPGGGGGVLAARSDPSVGPSGDARDGHPQAGRRRRRDRALERRADPLGAVDRGAARAREHGRAEAVRSGRRSSAG